MSKPRSQNARRGQSLHGEPRLGPEDLLRLGLPVSGSSPRPGLRPGAAARDSSCQPRLPHPSPAAAAAVPQCRAARLSAAASLRSGCRLQGGPLGPRASQAARRPGGPDAGLATPSRPGGSAAGTVTAGEVPPRLRVRRSHWPHSGADGAAATRLSEGCHRRRRHCSGCAAASRGLAPPGLSHWQAEPAGGNRD